VAGVSDSSPLLYLAALGDLSFLPTLFGKITIPQAVWQELVIDGRGKPGSIEVEKARGDWLAVQVVANREAVGELTSRQLQFGESEAIVLASELNERTVFMDDELAVREARSRGFVVLRTPAIYTAAKEQGWIERIQPKLNELRATGFRLRETHYQMILKDAKEL
jgi:predicted nucleic acid-binding protein